MKKKHIHTIYKEHMWYLVYVIYYIWIQYIYVYISESKINRMKVEWLYDTEFTFISTVALYSIIYCIQ